MLKTPIRLRIALVTGSLIVTLSMRSTPARATSDGASGPDFPNDAGPAQVDVSNYPKDIQADYRVFTRRCSQCHTLARAINSQNLQLTPDEQMAAKRDQPEIFKDEKIWRISEVTWLGYVQKMFGKPGSIIRRRPDELDQIIEFLVYDSKTRKMGSNQMTWRAQRQKLLDDFKKNNPKRYAELFPNG